MEEIRKVITEIEAKVAKMRATLMDVKTENSSLKSEIQLLKDKLKNREQEVVDFKEKYNALQHQDMQIPSDGSVNQADKSAEIDALVREIDNCIARLKAE